MERQDYSTSLIHISAKTDARAIQRGPPLINYINGIPGSFISGYIKRVEERSSQHTTTAPNTTRIPKKPDSAYSGLAKGWERQMKIV